MTPSARHVDFRQVQKASGRQPSGFSTWYFRRTTAPSAAAAATGVAGAASPFSGADSHAVWLWHVSLHTTHTRCPHSVHSYMYCDTGLCACAKVKVQAPGYLTRFTRSMRMRCTRRRLQSSASSAFTATPSPARMSRCSSSSAPLLPANSCSDAARRSRMRAVTWWPFMNARSSSEYGRVRRWVWNVRPAAHGLAWPFGSGDSSSATAAACPFHTASCSGVTPSRVPRLKLTPLSRPRTRFQSRNASRPERAARCSALHRSASSRLAVYISSATRRASSRSCASRRFATAAARRVAVARERRVGRRGATFNGSWCRRMTGAQARRASASRTRASSAASLPRAV